MLRLEFGSLIVQERDSGFCEETVYRKWRSLRFKMQASHFKDCKQDNSRIARKIFLRIASKTFQGLQVRYFKDCKQAISRIAGKPFQGLQASHFKDCRQAISTIAGKPFQRLQASHFKDCRQALLLC